MYRCKKCNKEFNRKDNKLRHEKIHSRNLNSYIKCTKCTSTFAREDSLKKHMRDIHKLSNDEVKSLLKNFNRHQSTSASSDDQEEEDQPSVSDNIIPCHECNEYVYKNQLKEHLNSSAHRNCMISKYQNVSITDSAFGKKVMRYKITSENRKEISLNDFMNKYKRIVKELVINEQIVHRAIKVQFIIFAFYEKVLDNLIVKKVSMFNFHTKYFEYLTTTSFDDFYEEKRVQIDERMQKLLLEGSNWSLKNIDSMVIAINKLKILKGSCFIELPKEISDKHAIINVRNINDKKCFLYAILSGIKYNELKKMNVSPKNLQRISNYKDMSSLNYDSGDIPMSIHNIRKFEEKNENISINIFGIEKVNKSNVHQIYGPIYHTKTRRQMHLNLLFIQDDDDDEDSGHFCFICDIGKLVSSQLSSDSHKKFVCDGCLIIFHDKNKYDHHLEKKECLEHEIILPKKNEVMKFNNFERQIHVKFTAVADFESILVPNQQEGETSIIDSHFPACYCYKILTEINDSYFDELRISKGENCDEKFILNLISDASYIYDKYFKKNSTSFDPKPYEDIKKKTTVCGICHEIFTYHDHFTGNCKVVDHDHVTNKFRCIAHMKCNLKYVESKFLNIVIHNINYDINLFIKKLAKIAYLNGKITILPLSGEKIISASYTFPVDGGIKFQLRFIDSFRFLNSSLDTLASTLAGDDFDLMKQYFDNESLKRVLRKGVFCYNFLSSYDMFEYSTFPSKENFYNKLIGQHITDEDYKYAESIWKHFNCQKLEDFMLLYVKVDVLLLCCIWKKFDKLSHLMYGLCVNHYFTLPSLSFDAMLKFTKINLELLSDIDQVAFFRNSIRGGVTVCNTHKSSANNRFMKEFDDKIPESYLLSLDFNNLYGKSLSQKLPYSGFCFIESENAKKEIFQRVIDGRINENSPIGFMFEVDISVDPSLHHYQDQMPFCPENKITPNSKYKKLILDFEPKKDYIIHYLNLKQIYDNKLKITKISRVLEFNQKAFLADYINHNTKQRAKAKTNFERDFFKLMNNAVFGKSIENVLRYRDIHIVSKWETTNKSHSARKLIAKPTFKNLRIIDENLVIVELKRIRSKMNKPTYIGATCLELAKNLNYRFYYDFILKEFERDKIDLLYYDTDSFIMNIQYPDVYAKLKPHLSQWFDTSNYSKEMLKRHDFPLVNSKVVGKVKDETSGYPFTLFVGLQAKSYCKQIEFPDELITECKSKGLDRYKIRELEANHYLNVLNDKESVIATINRIETKLGSINTVSVSKVALSFGDDKRFQIPGSFQTLAYGNNEIQKYMLISDDINDKMDENE